MSTARFASFLLLAIPACIPDATGSSSGGSGSVRVDGGEGGAAEDDASSVDPTRAALCDNYAQATAQCCDALPGTCPQTGTTAWKNHCLQYAASCAAMPTCFSGTDCNTLIYCTGGC